MPKNDVRLSKAQKEFIKRMRNGETVTFKDDSTYYYGFGFDNTETISFGSFFGLLADKCVSIKNKVVKLTELGKTIKID